MKQTVKSSKKTVTHHTPRGFSLFNKENYKWMVIGLVLIAIGLVMMVGGRSSDPNVFDKDAIYSFWRITAAPVLIVAGLIVEVYAIMKKSEN